MKHKLTLPLYIFGFALIAAAATGCSGINMSKSISPLDFLLPGLTRNGAPSETIPIETNSVALLAQASHHSSPNPTASTR
jgi:hypothetical protein